MLDLGSDACLGVLHLYNQITQCSPGKFFDLAGLLRNVPRDGGLRTFQTFFNPQITSIAESGLFIAV
mgnify:CR=1 FL=1